MNKKVPKILQKDVPVLREKARKVKKGEFGSKELMKVLEDLSNALESQYDGVAIAAPQIGESLRIFIVSWKIFAIKGNVDINDLEDIEKTRELKKEYKDKVFINPLIIKKSKGEKWMDEGCLSVRPYYGEVKRSLKCRVRANDEEGKVFEYGGSGLLSQIFQHEIEHLDGILFIDKARNVHTLTEHSHKASENI